MRSNFKRRKFFDLSYRLLGFCLLGVSFFILFALVFDLSKQGFSRLSYEFLTSFPSRHAEKAGILSAWVGSICVIVTTALSAIPIGIAAAIYLEEYAPKNWLTSIIEINISNLAAIPSIIYGLMALGLFVYRLQLGQSVLTAGLTLGLLILPMVIVTTRESLRSIPSSVREAAYALGCTRWQLIWHHLLPYSTGGILTGIIISLSRALGETAPLITIGALTFIAFLPTSPVQENFPFINFQWLSEPFTVLPIQMFNWVSRPQEAFHVNAAATGLVLLAMTLILNMTAIYIRYRFRKKIKW